MDTAYVQQRDDNLYVGASRVTLESVIASWQSGNSPEQVQEGFPSLPLVAVYAAITYYLEHRDELDAFFRETEERDAALQGKDEAAHADFYAAMRRRIDEARQRLEQGSPAL